ncbi:hypothetical protein [Pseudactinotalea terrae]|uniref:hypothetical protein n=1 Tax=Pseudactinotalea terrae TaxID=1743262 RepID=UPI0012E1C08F|nr:hypothetical protein [Pseudactinotalea terrae]
MDAHHLLVVPDGVTPADVEALVLSRFPSDHPPDGAARLAMEPLPGCRVEGPSALPAGVPAWAAAGYLLAAPEERGAPVPPALRGRGDLLHAFADGEPAGRERELLELGLALARRLGGALLTSTGMLVVPPPQPDLLLYSEVWLHPDALVHVLAPHLPGIALPGEPRISEALPADAATGQSLLPEDERLWLHAEADAYDEAALAQPDVTESYGVLAVEPEATWSVTVEAAINVPVALAGRLPGGAILYELRCYPSGQDHPRNAVERLDAAAKALLDAVGGVVVDDDGFLVHLG